MTAPDPKWVEAGANALPGGTNYVMSGDNGVAGTMNQLTATFVLAAVEPLIRAQVAADIEALHPAYMGTAHDALDDAARIALGES